VLGKFAEVGVPLAADVFVGVGVPAELAVPQADNSSVKIIKDTNNGLNRLFAFIMDAP